MVFPDSRPLTFCWMIAAEGCGHHMLRAVLKDFLASRETVDKGDYYPLLLKQWDNAQLPLPSTVVDNTVAGILEKYRLAGKRHIFEDTSFPFGGVELPFVDFISGGQNRGPLRRPDIPGTLASFARHCNTRLLVAYRSPISSVHSALRRGFSQNIDFECELVNAIHLYIASELKALPMSTYRAFDFEEFLARPAEHVKAIAEWWDISEEVLVKGLGNLKRAATLTDIPPARRARLESYFDSNRTSQWLPTYHLNRLVGA